MLHVKNLFLFLLVSLCGCLWFGHGPERAQARAVSVLSGEVSVDVVRGDVLSGGAMVFIPFIPGANTEAGPASDRVSLMIVKGAADAFTAKAGAFTLITEGDVDNARFVIEGDLERFDAERHSVFLGIGKKKSIIKIKGEVRERSTGEVVALISGSTTYSKQKDAALEAYEMGRAIGEKLQH